MGQHSGHKSYEGIIHGVLHYGNTHTVSVPVMTDDVVQYVPVARISVDRFPDVKLISRVKIQTIDTDMVLSPDTPAENIERLFQHEAGVALDQAYYILARTERDLPSLVYDKTASNDVPDSYNKTDYARRILLRDCGVRSMSRFWREDDPITAFAEHHGLDVDSALGLFIEVLGLAQSKVVVSRADGQLMGLFLRPVAIDGEPHMVDYTDEDGEMGRAYRHLVEIVDGTTYVARIAETVENWIAQASFRKMIEDAKAELDAILAAAESPYERI